MRSIEILLCTADEALAAVVEGLLTLWATEFCARMSLTRSAELTMGTWDLVFFDADSVFGEVSPELAQRTVLLTASQETALSWYCKHPVGLVPLPPTAAAVRRVMNQAFLLWRHGLCWLDIPRLRGCPEIPLCRIRYAESDGRGVKLHYVGGEARLSIPISRLAELLPAPPFYRCQHGFLVYMGAARDLVGGELVLTDTRERVPVSRALRKQTRELLDQWESSRAE